MTQDTLLGFPAHTLHPQGVCSIRRAAKPLTAALPYRRGEFTTLSTVSRPVHSYRAFFYLNVIYPNSFREASHQGDLLGVAGQFVRRFQAKGQIF